MAYTVKTAKQLLPQVYVDEYGWRYNHRKRVGMMFDLLQNKIAQGKMIKG